MKKNTLFIFLIALLLFGASFSFCHAFEFNVEMYPDLPFAQGITEDSALPDYIAYWFAFGIYVAGTLAALSLAVGGIQFIMSAEKPERINNAKERIWGSFAGLVILLGAFVILQTIHPKLPTLPIEIDLKPARGVILRGGKGTIPAPSSVADISKYSGYDSIEWPTTVQSNNGESIDNCDENVFAYAVYLYNDANFKNLGTSSELKCNGGSVGIGSYGSYVMVAEVPGVYLYSNPWCTGEAGSSDFPRAAVASSIPDLSKSAYGTNIKSVRIINGPDEDSGPFFGIMLFDASDYWGSRMWEFSPLATAGPNEQDKHCQTVDINIAASALIYQRAGANENPGAGVVLYSQRSQESGLGGLYCPANHPNDCVISGSDVMSAPGGSWRNSLSNMEIDYPAGTSLNDAILIACKNFNGPKNKIANCFESMKIDGNFLVLLSRERNDAYGGSAYKGVCSATITGAPIGQVPSGPTTCFQAFPSTDFEDGPPDINRTYIKAPGSQYIKIIPLAKPFL